MGGSVDTLLKNRHQLLVAACLNLGPFMYGYSLGWSAPIIIKLEDPDQTPLCHDVSSDLISFVATSIIFGQLIGPILVLHISNTSGRKPGMMISAACISASYVILASAAHIATVIAGRILCGLGVSIAYVLSTVYLGEIASTNIRGILLNTSGPFLTFGCLLVYSVGPFVPYFATCLIGLGLGLMQLASLYFLVPESPLFLAMKGRDKEAISTLELLNRHEDIDEIITKTKDKKEEKKSSLKELFTVKSNRKALLILSPLGILQQLSGVIVVTFFATTIFQLAGSSVEPYLATIFIGLTQFLSSSLCPAFVEHGGRRVLMMVSTSICTVSLAVLGTFFYLSHIKNPMAESIRWLPLASLIVFFIGLEIGFGILPVTLTGEMFSPNVRSFGSICTFQIAMCFGLLLSTVFPYMLHDMGAHFTFWIFSFACAFAFFYTYLFLPETKGKSLFEMQEILSR